MASQDLAGQTSSKTTTNHGTSTNAEAEKLKGHLERGGTLYSILLVTSANWLAGHIAMSHELKADGQKKVVSGYEQKIGQAPDSA